MAKLKIDFSGVESFQRPSEGQHVVKIASADLKKSQGGNDMIVVAYEVTKGQDKGARVFENYPLAENALWKLKGMLQAIGMKCDGKVQLDLDKLIGKMCIVEVIDDEYEGKLRSRVQECRKLAAVADEEDEEDEDIEEEEEDEALASKKKSDANSKDSKPATKKAPMNPPEDEDDEDDDDWDDDEEEEEPAPKKKPVKKSASTKKAPAKKKPEPEEDEDDDDDDWDEE